MQSSLLEAPHFKFVWPQLNLRAKLRALLDLLQMHHQSALSCCLPLPPLATPKGLLPYMHDLLHMVYGMLMLVHSPLLDEVLDSNLPAPHLAPQHILEKHLIPSSDRSTGRLPNLLSQLLALLPVIVRSW